MSRTVKARRPMGFEYWTARPFNKHGGTPCPYHKHRTHKAERREGAISIGDLIAEWSKDPEFAAEIEAARRRQRAKIVGHYEGNDFVEWEQQLRS